MWQFIRSLFGRQAPTNPIGVNRDDFSEPHKFTHREGKFVPVDEVFEAWTSGDLPRMLSALGMRTNLVDRHFLLMGIVKETYGMRANLEMGEKCLEVAQIHISEFPAIAPALRKEMGGILPRVSTFQHLATLLSERGEFEKAIDVCEQALKYGLRDGTKSGFEGRIVRIKRQQAKR